MKPNLESIAGVECLTLRGDEAHTAVIFLHGYGANMHDLFPLWEMWHQEKFSWFFPNGVQSLPMGYYEGRAWFSIDMEKLEEAMRTGSHRDMSTSIPPEFDDTLMQLEHLILEVSKKYNKVIIGGFSQGAMCASHLAMKNNLSLDGLILLSGNLMAEPRFPKAAKALPFYAAHGSRDPILPAEGAKRLVDKLESLGFRGKLTVFNGGHEIPQTVIGEVKSFLAQFAD